MDLKKFVLILAGVMLFITTVLFRYEIVPGAVYPGAYRMDRWTGEVKYIKKEYGESPKWEAID